MKHGAAPAAQASSFPRGVPSESVLRHVEAVLAQSLGHSLCLTMADAPLAEAALSAAGRARLTRFADSRRRQWLLGRAALDALLRRLHRMEDAAALMLPQPGLSLTHAGDLAFALGSQQADVWLGVDFEPERALRPGLGRLFLTAAEADALHAKSATGAETLLRVWTVKEAAFKADPANSGAVLRDYVLDSPLALQGLVRRGKDFVACYHCTPLAGGWLSAAVQLQPPAAPRGHEPARTMEHPH